MFIARPANSIIYQLSWKKLLTFRIYCVAVGRLSGSPKNPVSTGITFTMSTVTQRNIPTISIIGYAIAPLIFRVIESIFSVCSAIWRRA
jgi:hypothetical protein